MHKKSLLALFISIWTAQIIAFPIAFPDLSDIFNVFVICPTGEIVFRGEDNCGGATQGSTTENPTVTCKNCQFLHENSNSCIDFNATEELTLHINEGCGSEELVTRKNSGNIAGLPEGMATELRYQMAEFRMQAKNMKYWLVWISDNQLGIPTVRCACKTINLNYAVYHYQTSDCVTSLTQGSCNYLESGGQCGRSVCMTSSIEQLRLALHNKSCVGIWNFCTDNNSKLYIIQDEIGRGDCRLVHRFLTWFYPNLLMRLLTEEANKRLEQMPDFVFTIVRPVLNRMPKIIPVAARDRNNSHVNFNVSIQFNSSHNDC